MGRLGDSKYPLGKRAEERERMLKLIAEGRSNSEIARLARVPVRDVMRVRARFYPTGLTAKAWLKHKAFELAERIVNEANVAEAMDLLTRPNIGVLEPIKKGETQIGVFTTVTHQSLGGVERSIDVRGEINQNTEASTFGVERSIEPRGMTGQDSEMSEMSETGSHLEERRSGPLPAREVQLPHAPPAGMPNARESPVHLAYALEPSRQNTASPIEPPKRKRGRPRKHPQPNSP